MEIGISSGLIGHLACMQTLPLPSSPHQNFVHLDLLLFELDPCHTLQSLLGLVIHGFFMARLLTVDSIPKLILTFN